MFICKNHSEWIQTQVTKQALVNLRIGNRTTKAQTYIVNKLPVPLLVGRPALDSLGFTFSNESELSDTGQKLENQSFDIETMSTSRRGV